MRKLTDDEIAARLDVFGTIRLSERLFKCQCGNTWETSLRVALRGARCPKCARQQAADKVSSTIDDVNRSISEKPFICVEYTPGKTQGTFRCDHDHTFTTSVANARKGGCPVCSGRSKLTVEQINARITSGVTCIERTHQSKALFRCNTCEHEYETTVSSVLKGHGCAVCNRRSKDRLSIDTITDRLSNRRITLISYAGTTGAPGTTMMCSSGHIWSNTVNNVFNGSGCPVCAMSLTVSQPEQEMYDLILQYFPDAQQSVRNVISPYELDVYIPSLKIAFEMNGVYWHNDLRVDKSYHIRKRELCESKGVRLVSVCDKDWEERHKQCEALILNVLRVSSGEKYDARKCTVKSVPSAEYRNFMNEYHIQGAVNASFRIGLYAGDLLVACMSFSGKEMKRYASRGHVRGGASKLFKHSGLTECFTYTDLDHFTGETYRHLGFSPVDKVTIGYRVFHQGKMTSRHEWMRHKLQGYGTQHEIMDKMGALRIWNSGVRKWVKPA